MVRGFSLAALTVVSGCASTVATYLTLGALDYRKGIDAVNAGDYDGAIRSFNKAVQANPDEPVYYLYRGVVLMDQKSYARAIEDFDHAIALKPDFVGAFTDRGTAYLRQGDRDHAIADYTQAIKLQPDFYPALVNRGGAYWAAGNYKQAMDDFKRALTLNPEPPHYLIAFDRNQKVTWTADSAEALHNYCEMRSLTGQALDRALSDCDKSLALRPNHAETLYARALAHFRLDQFDSAVSDADAALGTEPRKAQVLYVRGLAKRRRGDIAAGDQDLELARGIDSKIDASFASMGIKP